jgi:hypothetical protein
MRLNPSSRNPVFFPHLVQWLSKYMQTNGKLQQAGDLPYKAGLLPYRG